jgi:predicted RNase H-like HicB family nuclease
MAAPLTLTALYEPVEDGWVQARVRELAAVITAAPTREEARTMLEDALREYLVAMLDPETADRMPAHGDQEQLAIIIGEQPQP